MLNIWIRARLTKLLQRTHLSAHLEVCISVCACGGCAKQQQDHSPFQVQGHARHASSSLQTQHSFCLIDVQLQYLMLYWTKASSRRWMLRASFLHVLVSRKLLCLCTATQSRYMPDVFTGVSHIQALVADRTYNVKPFQAAAHRLINRRMAVGSTELSVLCARRAACGNLMSAT